MKRAISLALAALSLCLSATAVAAEGGDQSASSAHLWKQITAEAEELGLPTQFLKAVPTDFVHFEFDDLQAFLSVDDEKYGIDRAEYALDLRAEVGVAGCVDDVDLGVFVEKRGVLAVNRNASLLLKVV